MFKFGFRGDETELRRRAKQGQDMVKCGPFDQIQPLIIPLEKEIALCHPHVPEIPTYLFILCAIWLRRPIFWQTQLRPSSDETNNGCEHGNGTNNICYGKHLSQILLHEERRKVDRGSVEG
mmetsp:Transcript_22632/g.65148  ORF Transcript_22632/g.65148 Transcript_22632/m.65148 type:complete len:121 (+) Transcript_22632:93-455(+)